MTRRVTGSISMPHRVTCSNKLRGWQIYVHARAHVSIGVTPESCSAGDGVVRILYPPYLSLALGLRLSHVQLLHQAA